MERLTKRLSNGVASWNYQGICYGEDEVKNKVFKSAHRQRACERLAAYEETGLSPEEVVKMGMMFEDSKRYSGRLESKLKPYLDIGLSPSELNALKLASAGKCVEEITEFEGITIDRLRELAQADKEGRGVVQRFSPGQTVWVIERDEDGEAYDFSGYVFVTSLRGIALVSPKINGSSEIDVILMDQVESRINYSDGCIEAYPADDCYLSREAAEKALGEDARLQEEEPSGC